MRTGQAKEGEILRGSRVSNPSGHASSSREQVGPIGDEITDLKLPLVPVHDTSYETAKNVDKGSQNAENETFEKSPNEQNDTMSVSDTAGKGFHLSNSGMKALGNTSNENRARSGSHELKGTLRQETNITAKRDPLPAEHSGLAGRTLSLKSNTGNMTLNDTERNELKSGRQQITPSGRNEAPGNGTGISENSSETAILGKAVNTSTVTKVMTIFISFNLSF